MADDEALEKSRIVLEETAKKIDDAKSGEKDGGDKEFVAFKIAKEEFALSISNIKEIIRVPDITRVPNCESTVEGVINLRGKIHLLINLARKLCLKERAYDNNTRVLIVETANAKRGLIVDSVAEVIKLNIASLQKAPEIITKSISQEAIEGVFVLGERPITLLNPEIIIESGG